MNAVCSHSASLSFCFESWGIMKQTFDGGLVRAELHQTCTGFFRSFPFSVNKTQTFPKTKSECFFAFYKLCLSHWLISFFPFRCSKWRRFAATTDAPVRWTERALLTRQHTNGPGKPPDWHSGFAWPAPKVSWSPRGCCIPVCSAGKGLKALIKTDFKHKTCW